jgi:tRNA (guanosine-2'-O-)-methyltransferase
MVQERIDLINRVSSNRTNHLCLVLENLYQEHNASAILRNADAFGVQNIHVIEDENDFAANTEISMSAHKWLNIKSWDTQKNNTYHCLSSLKKQGYKICATTMREGAITLDELPIDNPIAMCFGTELNGLSEEAHELADYMVYIPMHGFIQSFNVSVASALSISHLLQKIKLSEIKWTLSNKEIIDLKIDWSLKSLGRASGVLKRYLKEI